MQKTAELPAVVAWDRREADRRSSAHPTDLDRRKTERRQSPPFTWEVADFVVVDHAAARRLTARGRAPSRPSRAPARQSRMRRRP